MGPGPAPDRPDRAAKLNYEAAESQGRRRLPKVTVKSEDDILPHRKRQKVNANNRDLHRNFVLACWIVRKHLDYVTAFTLQAKTGDGGLDDEIEAMVREKSKAINCHLASRHPLRRIIRNAEARRVIDGDIGFEKIAPPAPNRLRGRLNVIEGDRIVNDAKIAKDEQNANWVNGVRVNKLGESTAYAVAMREGNTLKHEKVIQARNFYLHAYWDATHRFDQVRGISPFASAMNMIRDTGDGFNMAMMRLKVAQMFGLKITRDGGELEDGGQGAYATPTIDSDEDGTPDTGYELNLFDGPFQLDMDPGEDAAFLENKTPATETVNFLQLMIHLAIKCIDLPYSFFDESHTNFFGSRGALMHYLRSCRHKIQDNQDLLDWITKWWLGLWVADGELILPRSVSFDQIRWEWVPDGVPWWDPSKEVRGNGMAIASGLDNFERVTRENGTDVYENIDINARVLQYAQNAGVQLILPDSGAYLPANEVTVENQ